MKKLTTIILCILLFSQLYTIYSIDKLQANITDTRARVETMDSTVRQYQQEVSEYKAYVSSWKGYWDQMYPGHW